MIDGSPFHECSPDKSDTLPGDVTLVLRSYHNGFWLLTHANSVLYIAGWGRSGSTLLEELLADATGAFAAGEVERFWDSRFEQRSCQCGEPFEHCPFWSQVLDRVGSATDRAEVRGARSDVLRYRRLPRVVLSLRTDYEGAWSVVADGQRVLYESIMSVADCPSMIDSSKVPVLPLLSRRLQPHLEMRVVHLVRHPASVAYSWRQPKPGIKRSHRVIVSGFNWTLRNLVADLSTGPQDVRVRYEDLTGDPRHVVTECADKFGLSVNMESVAERGGHAVAGNPSRSAHPIVTTDERWRGEMSLSEMAQTALMTWPLALRYGYSLRR